MNIPETVTPWAVMGVAVCTLLGMARKWVIWPAFKRGVAEVIAPLLGELRVIRLLAEKTAEDLANYQTATAEKATTRAFEIDEKFGSMNRRLDALHTQRSRDTQKVVEAVQTVQDTVSAPANGDAA